MSNTRAVHCRRSCHRVARSLAASHKETGQGSQPGTGRKVVPTIVFALAAAGGLGAAEPQKAGNLRYYTGVFAGAAAASGFVNVIPLFPAASDQHGRQGFARIINHSAEAGEVAISAFDDAGESYGPLSLSLGADETAHFNSDDLESGNPAKGLTGATGVGQGDWRLELTSDIDIEVLSFIRTNDGFLTSMHDHAPREADGYRIPIFNPGSNRMQESLLRLVNPGQTAAMASITGTDDAGAPGTGTVTANVPPGAARTYSATELESGSATGLDGALGDGAGKWRLHIGSGQPVVALSLLSSPRGYLANLSSAPRDAPGFVFEFARGPQGFVADFADYPHDGGATFELVSDYRPLPSPLEPRSALFISGVNRSDDLFMFFKGQIDGLVPGAHYAAHVSVEIATDTPAGCFGIGGAPGESVWIKAGVTATEPLPVLEGSYLRMNVDIGNQSNGGEQAVVLGDITNSRDCEQPRQWERKSFPVTRVQAPVTASPAGRAWLLFGVDSGFEGRTDIYFTRAAVDLQPM